MSDSVKKRSYEAAGRRAASAANRQRIIEAARELMLANGYRATTVAAVAAAADVNVDTIYQLIGRKPLLLRELIEQAVSGQDRAVVAEQRPPIQAIRAEPDPATKLTMYARVIADTHQRLAPLFVVLRDASATEPEAMEVWQEISERRANNMRKFITEIADTGRLRPELTIAAAADTIWVLNSPEVYVMLTTERGWTPSRYEQWLAETWIRLFLT